MNKQRRKELTELARQLGKVKNIDDLDEYISTLEDLKGEEEDYYYNAPENLQYSWRYEMSQEAIDNMDEALNCLGNAQNCEGQDELESYIEDAISYIMDASM